MLIKNVKFVLSHYQLKTGYFISKALLQCLASDQPRPLSLQCLLEGKTAALETCLPCVDPGYVAGTQQECPYYHLLIGLWKYLLSPHICKVSVR